MPQKGNKAKLNAMVLNYLIVEGYEASAVKFAKEIGVDLEKEDPANLSGLQSIRQRNEIKLLLVKGDIEKIIDKLNEYYPFLLERNDFLYFKILLLNLVEIIKKHQFDTEKENKSRRRSMRKSDSVPKKASDKKRRLSSAGSSAGSFDRKKVRRSVIAKLSEKELEKEQAFFNSIIKFVKEKLFNKAIKDKAFLQDLELSMCLLLFDFNDLRKEEAQFLPPSLLNLVNNKMFKNEVFNHINNAILNYNSRFLDDGTPQVASSQVVASNISDFNDAYKDNYVFYQTDSDDESMKEEPVESRELEELEDCANEGVVVADSGVNSRFKKLINLWMWSENVLNDAYKDIPRLNLEKLVEGS